jgi:hypothetical protein
MAFTSILTEKCGRVDLITLNRPQALNTLNAYAPVYNSKHQLFLRDSGNVDELQSTQCRQPAGSFAGGRIH